MLKWLKNQVADPRAPAAPPVSGFAIPAELEAPLRKYSDERGQNYRDATAWFYAQTLCMLGPRDEVPWTEDDFSELFESFVTTWALAPIAPPLLRLRGFTLAGPALRETLPGPGVFGSQVVNARTYHEFPDRVTIPAGEHPDFAIEKYFLFTPAKPRPGISYIEAHGFWWTPAIEDDAWYWEFETTADFMRMVDPTFPAYANLSSFCLRRPMNYETEQGRNHAVYLGPACLAGRLARHGAQAYDSGLGTEFQRITENYLKHRDSRDTPPPAPTVPPSREELAAEAVALAIQNRYSEAESLASDHALAETELRTAIALWIHLRRQSDEPLYSIHVFRIFEQFEDAFGRSVLRGTFPRRWLLKLSADEESRGASEEAKLLRKLARLGRRGP